MTTRQEAVARIAAAVKNAGGVEKYSRQVDIQVPYIENVLAGRTSPGKRISASVGLELIGDTIWREMRR